MKRMIFRFIGKLPKGKIELTCLCGSYFDDYRIDSAGQGIVCPKCGLKFELVQHGQHEDHWHLFITPKN